MADVSAEDGMTVEGFDRSPRAGMTLVWWWQWVPVATGDMFCSTLFVAGLTRVAGGKGLVLFFCFHRIARIVGLRGMPSFDSTRYLTLISLPIGGLVQ